MNLILDEEKLMQGLIIDFINKGEEYEPEVCQFMRSFLEKGDNFVDVGAHIGYFTILASELVLGGKVVAFEPEEENYETLTDNIEKNGYVNTTAFQACVGDESKDVELFVNRDNDGGHSIYDPSTHPFNTRTRKLEKIKQTVPMVRLDDVIGFVPKLIKIDCEGCEVKVIRGAEGIIRKHSPALIIEVNRYSLNEAGESPKSLQEYLESLGYKGYRLETGKYQDLTNIHTDFGYVFNMVFLRVNNQ